MANGGKARLPAQPAMRKGSRLRAINRPKTTAPATRSMIMAEVRVVLAKDFKKPSQLRFRPAMLTSRTPAAPTAPASVGVNQPVIRPTRERVKTIRTSSKPPRSAASRSRHDA